MSILEAQLQELRQRFSDAIGKSLPSGTTLVTVPMVRLPKGWTKPNTAIRFLVPVGYPYAALDCFWADDDLRLADQRVPQNAAASNIIPEDGTAGLWFSWHLAQPWNPNRDTLSSWMNAINERLRRLQ